MLYLACTTISSVDLAQYGVSLAKDWVSVECGTSKLTAWVLIYQLNHILVILIIILLLIIIMMINYDYK